MSSSPFIVELELYVCTFVDSFDCFSPCKEREAVLVAEPKLEFRFTEMGAQPKEDIILSLWPPPIDGFEGNIDPAVIGGIDIAEVVEEEEEEESKGGGGMFIFIFMQEEPGSIC